MNYDTMQGYADEQPIDLPNKDFMLLSYLMQNQGKVLDRESILIKVWGFDYECDTRVVDTHIKKIRKALGSYSKYIKTKIGTGYIFV